ncbi:glycoside hydrolase family 43 protein [Alloscardovia omnicolens]|uniref:glycoside hydrolase family 43 protein n=1 Tax=Alloscardovia omnicolens TaxID=419015 RepID=UPI003A5FED84
MAQRSESVNWAGDTGIRLMASGIWSGSSDTHIEVSQGHNSAINASDGKSYIVYHTRFSDTNETHEVRTRELLQTSDGWLSAAPFENTGEAIKQDKIKTSDLAGSYDILIQNPHTSFKGQPRSSKSKKKTTLRGVTSASHISLKSDGKIEGDMTGQWKASGTDITITADGVTYTAVASYQHRETDKQPVLTFTGIGNNQSIWGYKTK